MNAKTEEFDQEEAFQNAIDMSVSNLGQALMGLVIQELKALPDVWQKLPQFKQDEVIERIRLNVDASVGSAVQIIASQGCQRVTGDLKKVSIEGGKKEAVVAINTGNSTDSLHALYESTKQPVLIVVAAPDQFTGGMDEIRGEPDQYDMYGESAEDGEVTLTIPSPDDMPPEDFLDEDE